MPSPANQLMTPERFLDWCLDQEGRWELDDGVPVQAMTGATRRHDTVVVNTLAALHKRLAGTRCSAQTADQAVRTRPNSIRRPDVTVDCGPTADDALESSRPTAVFEVLSPSTRKTDRFRKLDEYRAVESLQHVALIDPDQAVVLLYTRTQAGDWRADEVEGLDTALALAAIDVDLPLAEIYAGMTFTPA